MLTWVSIEHISGHILSIVDADLYIIHEEMLILVEVKKNFKECFPFAK